MEGTSLAYTFDNAKAKERHTTQYFEIAGNRAIYHDGWYARTIHRAPWESKARRALQDNSAWELFDVRSDFSLAHDLAAKNPNVVFHMINSAEADDRASIAAEAKANGLTIPILDDEYQLIGNSLGFTYAGEAVIVDPKKNFEIVYHGPADTIETALSDVVAGKVPAAAEVMASKGTKLVFADRGKEAEFAKISYSNDVVPILMDKCVDCHQPNGIAPWHMTNYQQVKTFAPMIREAIRRDRMPPTRESLGSHHNRRRPDRHTPRASASVGSSGFAAWGP